jgi:EmrB/QacA subfamily drug resistance transporter
MSTTCATKVSPAALSVGLDETAGLDPRRWRALPVILIGSFLAFLDFFIVNIALPAMRAELSASPAQLQFIVAAYGIAFGVSLITGGRLGDIFGRKRVFLIGIGGFTITSALCGLAPTPETLIACRVAQAICAATVTPQVLAIIRVEFAASERPIAIGLYGASMGLASITAQLLGGLLVSLNLFGWSWRLIFLINIPIGLVAIALAARMIRESRGSNRATLDLVGVALASLGLFLLIYPIVEGRESGWPAWSFAMLATTVPVLVGFVLHERQVIRRGRTPLIALHLFRIGVLRLGLVVSVVFFSTAGVFFVVLTVFFQAGLGLSAFRAGLMFLPFAIGFSASSIVSGPIANRIGARIINLGTFLMALGLLSIIAFTQISNATSGSGAVSLQLLVPIFFVYGLGQGLAQPALINTVIGGAGVTGDDAGSAVGLFLTTAQSVIALGVAAIGDVFFAWLSETPTTATYLNALTASLACNFVLIVATFFLALLLPRPVAART